MFCSGDVVLEVVQGAGEDEEHLLVEAGDVIPHHEDDGAEFASDRDGVLGVHLLVLVGLSLRHQLLIDHPRLDRAGKLDEELTRAELTIAEVLQRLLQLESLVDPREHIVLGLGSDDLQVVDLHQLPDHGKDVLLVSVTNIRRINTDHLDTEELHGVSGQVTVVILIEDRLGLHLRLGPVDASVVDAMADAEDDETITNLFVKVIDEAVLDLHGVDPETVGALLFAALDVVVDDAASLNLLLGELLETMLAVEDGSDEDGVDLSVALDQVAWSNGVLDAHGGGVGNHFGGSLNIIGLLEGVKAAVFAIKLVENVEELFGVLEGLSKVCNLFLLSRSQVEVHPAEQHILRLLLLQIGQLFTLLEETVDLWHLREADGLHVDEAGELPQDTKHQVRRLVEESLRIDTDDANETLGDSEGLVEVLTDLVQVDVGALVDGTHVDGLLFNLVQQMDHNHTI